MKDRMHENNVRSIAHEVWPEMDDEYLREIESWGEHEAGKEIMELLAANQGTMYVIRYKVERPPPNWKEMARTYNGHGLSPKFSYEFYLSINKPVIRQHEEHYRPGIPKSTTVRELLAELFGRVNLADAIQRREMHDKYRFNEFMEFRDGI